MPLLVPDRPHRIHRRRSPGRHDDRQQHRTLSLTGTGSSAAIQGAVEFFCSADRMRDLKRRLGGSFPPNYQVVIKCTTSRGRLIAYEYERHVVVEKK